MKYVRCVAVSVMVDARRLLLHDEVSSLPIKQLNGIAQVGQPVPM